MYPSDTAGARRSEGLARGRTWHGGAAGEGLPVPALTQARCWQLSECPLRPGPAVLGGRPRALLVLLAALPFLE